MYKFEGKKIFKGIAIGKIKFYSKGMNVVIRKKIEDTQAEIRRFEEARNIAIRQLQELHDKAVKEVGEMNAEIFDVLPQTLH